MKQKLLKSMLLLCILVGGVCNAWGEESTVTASKVTSSSVSWTGSGGETWSVSVDGGATNQNVSNGYAQVGTSSSASTSISFSTSEILGTITSIEVNCAAYQGKAKISATVDGNDFGTQNQSVPSWSSNNGGTKTFSGSDSGAIVITMTNGSGGRAMYIKSITVTYTPSGGGSSDPSISASNVNIAQDATNGSIGYTLNNATGNVTAEVTDGDWLTLGTVTASAVPFTCSANTGAERTATVTLSFTGATDKIVTVTQAAKTVDAPVFNPEGGNYMQGTNITISSEGNTIYYNLTTDGSAPATPTNASTEYTAPIILSSGTTKIKAIAYDTYGNASSVVTRTYTGIALASLPFGWSGGTGTNIQKEDGIVGNSLSDYADTQGIYRTQLNASGDYIVIYTDAKPLKVLLGVKMVGGSNTSKIKVQESANGIGDYSNVEELTISGSQNDILNLETTSNFSATTRAIKLLFEKGSNVGVGPITILGGSVPVTLTSEGYATFASTYPLDFTNSNIKAYIATAAAGSSVNLSAVNKVPSNTGVVLNYSGEVTENIPVFDGTGADDVDGNCLLVSDGTVKGGTGIYALANKNHGIGFYQVNNSVTIPKGKAYLQTGANTKEFLIFNFSDDETGINTVNSSELMVNGSIFNLSGQRISKLQKGVNIVNGKKVLF